MRRRGVEQQIALRGFRGIHPAQITDPLGYAFAVPQLRVAVALVVLDGHVGHSHVVAAAISRGHPHQEEAMLGNPRSGAVAQLGRPLGFEDRVDNVPHGGFLAQRVAADRERGAAAGAGRRKESGGNHRQDWNQTEMPHIAKTIFVARLGHCQAAGDRLIGYRSGSGVPGPQRAYLVCSCSRRSNLRRWPSFSSCSTRALLSLNTVR